MAGAEVRGLTERDIDAAIRLTDLEGWGYTREDWLRLLALAPDRCFGAERDGELIGVLSTTSYGPLAYLGAVIVRTDVRGQGIGEAMMRVALDRLERDGVETVRLHSYLRVVPFYERLGFRQEHPNHRWEGTRAGTRGARVRKVRKGELADVAAFDAGYFGADRRKLLDRLFEEFPRTFLMAESHGRVAGYIVGNASRGSCEIGPWIVEPGNADAARQLFAGVMHSADAGSFAFTAPAPNEGVMVLAREAGFQESVRYRTVRMVRGRDAHGGRPEGIWAFAGLEKG